MYITLILLETEECGGIFVAKLQYIILFCSMNVMIVKSNTNITIII